MFKRIWSSLKYIALWTIYDEGGFVPTGADTTDPGGIGTGIAGMLGLNPSGLGTPAGGPAGAPSSGGPSEGGWGDTGYSGWSESFGDTPYDFFSDLDRFSPDWRNEAWAGMVGKTGNLANYWQTGNQMGQDMEWDTLTGGQGTYGTDMWQTGMRSAMDIVAKGRVNQTNLQAEQDLIDAMDRAFGGTGEGTTTLGSDEQAIDESGNPVQPDASGNYPPGTYKLTKDENGDWIRVPMFEQGETEGPDLPQLLGRYDTTWDGDVESQEYVPGAFEQIYGGGPENQEGLGPIADYKRLQQEWEKDPSISAGRAQLENIIGELSGPGAQTEKLENLASLMQNRTAGQDDFATSLQNLMSGGTGTQGMEDLLTTMGGADVGGAQSLNTALGNMLQNPEQLQAQIDRMSSQEQFQQTLAPEMDRLMKQIGRSGITSGSAADRGISSTLGSAWAKNQNEVAQHMQQLAKLQQQQREAQTSGYGKLATLQQQRETDRLGGYGKLGVIQGDMRKAQSEGYGRLGEQEIGQRVDEATTLQNLMNAETVRQQSAGVTQQNLLNYIDTNKMNQLGGYQNLMATMLPYIQQQMSTGEKVWDQAALGNLTTELANLFNTDT